LQLGVHARLPGFIDVFGLLGRLLRLAGAFFTAIRPSICLSYEHMFWRPTHTSDPSGAVHRTLGLAREMLLLDQPVEDAHGPAESRAFQSPVPEWVHRPQLRARRRRCRAGAVLERPQHCLCPITPLVCSRPVIRVLDKHAVGC
jgi:hypothetical protein